MHHAKFQLSPSLECSSWTFLGLGWMSCTSFYLLKVRPVMTACYDLNLHVQLRYWYCTLFVLLSKHTWSTWVDNGDWFFLLFYGSRKRQQTKKKQPKIWPLFIHLTEQAWPIREYIARKLYILYIARKLLFIVIMWEIPSSQDRPI